MAEWMYVDHSNVFIEGMRVSAVENGMALDIADAMESSTVDFDYRMDFFKLYRFVVGADKSKVARAVMFGSGHLDKENVRVIAEHAGFEVKVHRRSVSNREKKVDADIVTEMVRDAYRNASGGDTFNLVAGDRDFVPAVERLVSDGIRVDVIFWKHASGELKDTCSNFISLNRHLDLLKIRPREEHREDVVQTA